jgi:hypothetical protein
MVHTLKPIFKSFSTSSLYPISLDPKPDKKSKPELRVYNYNTHFFSFLTNIKCNNKTLLTNFIIFYVQTVVAMVIIVFWNVTPCNLAEWLFHLKDSYFS